MQHQVHLADHLGQHLLGHPLIGEGLSWGSLTRVEPALAQLQIPVADIVPGEFVQPLGRFTQGITAVALGRLPVHPGQTGEDPAVRQLQGSGVGITELGRRFAAQVHQRETGGVPQLVGEVARGLHRGRCVLLAVVIQADVLPRTGHFPYQGEAQSIGAVAVDQQQRIDAVAGALAHLAVLLIPHQAVDVDVLERHLTGEGAGHHRHPGHPEKNDVETRHQRAGRVPALEIGTVGIGPTQGGEGPEAAGEPGVEHVFVLLDLRRRAVLSLGLLQGFGFVAGHHVGRGVGVSATGLADHEPGRNAMAPPELAADAPVADVGEPIAINLLPALGDEAGILLLKSFAATGRHGLGFDKPLG